MSSLAAARPVTFIMTGDAAASRSFYQGVLGLPLGPQDAFATVYDLGNTTLRVTEIPDFKTGAHPALGWHVDDINATVTSLGSKGVNFTIYPGYNQDELGIWTAPDGRAKVAWFNDPDGNVLSLTQS
ncbi:VOC family protein [Sandarakinorhabdus sp.]|uniref:VOC family protein n=1 Tax=Sandarakinorhabdus sp. TaxID=1916663 RepID=UPI00286DD2A2|nr:VOC family protein [Sandarakinorhabdus sp.]